MGETVPQETNAHPELQASDSALSEQAGTRAEGHEKRNEASETSPLVSAESPVATPRHGTAPKSPAEVAGASALVSAETLVTTPRHGTVPDLDAEGPAAALAPSTFELSAASPLSATVPRPISTAASPYSIGQKDAETVLPHNAESPPTPVRNPVRPHGTKSQSTFDKEAEAAAVRQKNLRAILSPSAEAPATPVRNPVRPHGPKTRQ